MNTEPATTATTPSKPPVAPKQRRMTSTERVLAGMLTQNTGRALCDSGDAYGRHWQRNTGRNFLAEPEATLTVRKGYDGGAELEVTFNVFHWLASRLRYSSKMQARYKRFAAKPEYADSYDIEVMEAFAMKRNQSDNYVCDGDPRAINTYNGEDLLSQTIQYVMWHDADGCYYIALQVHGGCDVRGGYMDPRIFEVTGSCGSGEGSDMWNNARGTIYEDVPADWTPQPRLPGVAASHADYMAEQPYWSTDDGCHWYPQGSCGRDYRQLEDYPVVDEGDGETPPEDGSAFIRIDADGVAYGPIHGGKLHVSFD